MTRNTTGRADLALVQDLCESINTPKALALWLMIKYSDEDQIKDLSIDALEYDSASAFAADYLIVNILSKWKGFTRKGKSTAAVAIDKWKSVEAQNRDTNARLRSPLQAFNPAVERVFLRAQQKVAMILGKAPTFKELAGHCSWSNGATFDIRRGRDFTQKMTSRLTVTHKARRYAESIVGHDPLWFESLTGIKLDGPCSYLIDDDSIVVGNRLTTVPKNSKTDRVINIEPTMNIYIQKGLGKIIRQKLRSWGVDLDDQTKNQYLASIAHKLDLATIDLSSASDTVSYYLVLDLLPIDWFVALDLFRCDMTLVGSDWVKQEKFSSMGNGFTFELESLLFYALASAACEEEGLCNWYTSVFGDDIIVPQLAYPLVKETLVHCGFSLNEQKSFSSGQFFESCGKHYFSGTDVTPTFLKNVLLEGSDIIIAHNRLYRWSKRTGVRVSRTLKLFRSLFRKKLNLKDSSVPRIPDFCVDDRGFLVDPTHLPPPDRNRGYRCVCYLARSQVRRTHEIAFYAHKLAKQPDFVPDPLGYRTSLVITSSDPKGHAKLGTNRVTYWLKYSYINM